MIALAKSLENQGFFILGIPRNGGKKPQHLPQGERRVVNVKVEIPGNQSPFLLGQDEISGQPAYAGRKRSKLLMESK